jgi:hypothetical protein
MEKEDLDDRGNYRTGKHKSVTEINQGSGIASQ